MRAFMHKGGYERVAKRLEGAAVEIALVDDAGNCEIAGKPVPLDQVNPDVVWMSNDLMRTGQMGLFFKMALTSPNAKWLQTFNTGLDHGEYRAVFDKGLTLTNSDAQAVAIAEYTFAKVFNDWFPIALHASGQAKHEWTRAPFREISMSHWLIVGFGNIGRQIAIRAHAFGATVNGIRRTATPDPDIDQMGTLADLPAMLPKADVVVLAATMNAETADIANAAFFGAMKKGSILVNIGRGGLVDDAALIAALDRDQPAVAILDVFKTEPLPADNPYWSHPKVRVTAHNSAAGRGTTTRGDQLFVDNLKRFLAGETMKNVVAEKHF